MKTLALLGFGIFMIGLYMYIGKKRMDYAAVAYVGLLIITLCTLVETKVYWGGLSPAIPAGIAFLVLVVGAKALLIRKK